MRIYTKYWGTRRKRRRAQPALVYVALTVLLLGGIAWLYSYYRRAPEVRPKQVENLRQSPMVPSNAPAPRLAETHQPGQPQLPRQEASTNQITTPQPARTLFEAQVALVREGISPGTIDGVWGSQTRAAIRAFQRKHRLPETGDLDAATTQQLLLVEPAQTVYQVTNTDLARLHPVGKSWFEKSQQPRLEYETILEMVAEKGQANENLVRSLNPEVDWAHLSAGTSLRIPNAVFPSVYSKASFLRISLSQKFLEAFDSRTNLLAHFPCSIARQVEKRPVGRLAVESVVFNPNYRFDPAIFPESAEGRRLGRRLIIPAGPNNPVGTAWIGLNLPGYGIHGTPSPEQVGRTESHGCFRLANWSAEYLAKLVQGGTLVYVER